MVADCVQVYVHLVHLKGKGRYIMDLLLAGVGGQGTVLASKMIAGTYLRKGNNVLTAETIGMAQRGGCVVSHVRIGDKIYSPLVPLNNADLIIGFEPAEAVRSLPYLKKEGLVIVSKRAVKPVTDALADSAYSGENMLEHLKQNVKTITIDTQAVCEELGSDKIANIVLIGAAIKSGILNISLEDMKQTIKEMIKEKYIEMNMEALMKGYNTGDLI